jgi:glycosyltransferase involved in cell wall biosynthesis
VVGRPSLSHARFVAAYAGSRLRVVSTHRIIAPTHRLTDSPTHRYPAFTMSRPIRVTFVQPYLPAYRAPVYRALAAEPGIDFTLVHASTPWLPNVPADGFRAVFEPMRIFHLAKHPTYWQPSYWRHAVAAECDVFCAMWDVHYAPMVLPALARARRQGVGTVLWGQGYSRHESWLRRRPRALMAHAADSLVFYNDTGRDLFVGDGFDPNRMFVAYNSLDTTKIDAALAAWHADPSRLDTFRREHGLDDGRPLALCVARLFPDRKAERLIEAAARLWATGARFRVAFVGAVEEPYGAALRQLVADRGLTDCVRFEPGTYDEMKLAGWFLASRVFAFPSFAGLSLHHALAYGLPVLCTDRLNANHPEIEALEPGTNGMTYRDGDLGDFARQLGRMLFDDALTSHLKSHARKVIDDRFNVGRMVKGFVDAIRYADAAARARR